MSWCLSKHQICRPLSICFSYVTFGKVLMPYGKCGKKCKYFVPKQHSSPLHFSDFLLPYSKQRANNAPNASAFSTSKLILALWTSLTGSRLFPGMFLMLYKSPVPMACHLLGGETNKQTNTKKNPNKQKTHDNNKQTKAKQTNEQNQQQKNPNSTPKTPVQVNCQGKRYSCKN